MQSINGDPGRPRRGSGARFRRAAWWSAGAFVSSLLALLISVPAPAGAAATGHGQLAEHDVQSAGSPFTGTWTKSSGRPGAQSYAVSVVATWKIPTGSRVSFQPVDFNCTTGPVYSSSFTTDSDPYEKVIPLMTADQGFPCLLEFTRGWWKVTVTPPNGHSTQVDFVDQQIAPLTYMPICTAGQPACVGFPRPAVPVSSVVFSY
jgi:hypothetical protein